MRPELVATLDRWGLHSLTGLVPTTGFVYGLILVVVGTMFWKRAREAGLPGARVFDLWLLGSIAAAIGARLYYLTITDGFRLPVRSWFSLSGTGSWGAYVGAAVAVYLYGMVKGPGAWVWVDVVASVAPLAEVIGRWGCWLAGDDFGKVTRVPWAIRFPQGSPPWQTHVSRGLLPPSADHSLPVHPEQFYLLANALLVFLVISAVWRSSRSRPGVTFAAFLLVFGATRFGWEFLRDPVVGGPLYGLSSSQWMCLGFVVIGASLLLALRHERAPMPNTTRTGT